MELYLIRHGATAGNLEKRYVGTTDEPLTQEAVRQLKHSRRNYPAVQQVITSPMLRCRQTAELLFPGIASEVIEDLRECAFGSFEYKNYQELAQDVSYQRWIDSNGSLPFPQGESQKTFSERSCRAFLAGCRMLLARGCQSAAYVVHGGTIMAVMERFCRKEQPYFVWQVKNAEGFHLHLSEAEWDRDMEAASGAVRFLELAGSLPVPEEQLHRTGIEQVTVRQKHKELQCGYTTGSCAAAAAKAAAQMLLSQEPCPEVALLTPKGIALQLEVLHSRISRESASCAVRKFAGDDPDQTDGLLICVKAERCSGAAAEEGNSCGSGAAAEEGSSCGSGTGEKRAWVEIDGGEGVGRVTKAGLEQPVGAAAINRVPRRMITENVCGVCEAYGYTGGIRITVSVPGGREAARHTFNPHLGIVGGISILGTSGIVVPMSEQALIESIRVEMRQKAENGERFLLITPGNYGADFLNSREQYQMLRPEYAMKCSNYVGETLDMAAELGIRGILFVAHIGKFIKVSGGIMNTHSAHADCRAELMAAQAMRAGAAPETVRRLLASNTTEEALEILKEQGELSAFAEEALGRIQLHLQKRCESLLQTEVVLFSNRQGYLGETGGAGQLMQKISEEKRRLFLENRK